MLFSAALVPALLAGIAVAQALCFDDFDCLLSELQGRRRRGQPSRRCTAGKPSRRRSRCSSWRLDGCSSRSWGRSWRCRGCVMAD
ncbi:hypothetical protein GGTG_10563 [Gaeumannomyces tritici R3-111a-1]|uniref:Uncharacterized protein n=1 Tax=Gaeumannomyces tritici (strain R3-111a-1) TaxID=644352 RepID=J3PAN8_GAET3|nr:hypothetical protein GGTG_10563 [Gaeumannomyces tritici R3-111a-1]EJT71304.1 hypothetical protein GGTG_10563 [Gaeumannomyces tritici R3-111a-1]